LGILSRPLLGYRKIGGFEDVILFSLELEEDKLKTALKNIQNNTPFQSYWNVLNPLECDIPATGTGDLIDDLFDIYKDLKLGITHFDKVEGYKEWAFGHSK
jgi:hypothetical protein